MGSCQTCGGKIADNYKFCVGCNIKIGNQKSFREIAATLKQMNWNLGIKNEFIKRTNPELWAEIEKEWKAKKKTESEENDDVN